MSQDYEAFLIVAIIILILSVVMDVYSIYLMKLHKRNWYTILPLFLWSIHLTIFYAFIVYADSKGTNLNIIFNFNNAGEVWSSIQRLHGVITIFYMTYILHLEMKN